MSLCSRKRIKAPNGTWDYECMIGAKVHVNSTPISNFFGTFCVSDEYTIKDIYFQVSLPGKCITIIELEGLPGKFFTWKDLQIIEVNEPKKVVNAVCGEFLCGEVICGKGVSHKGTWKDDLMNSRLGLVDDSENLPLSALDNNVLDD